MEILFYLAFWTSRKQPTYRCLRRGARGKKYGVVRFIVEFDGDLMGIWFDFLALIINAIWRLGPLNDARIQVRGRDVDKMTKDMIIMAYADLHTGDNLLHHSGWSILLIMTIVQIKISLSYYGVVFG